MPGLPARLEANWLMPLPSLLWHAEQLAEYTLAPCCINVPEALSGRGLRVSEPGKVLR